MNQMESLVIADADCEVLGLDADTVSLCCHDPICITSLKAVLHNPIHYFLIHTLLTPSLDSAATSGKRPDQEAIQLQSIIMSDLVFAQFTEHTSSEGDRGVLKS